MLKEIALTPEIFQESSYASADMSRILLKSIKEPLLEEFIVRNLHQGNWLKMIIENINLWSPVAKEIVRKLQSQNRLKVVSNHSAGIPNNDIEWCTEAIASHSNIALESIVTSTNTKANFETEGIVNSIERIDACLWWARRSKSQRLHRQIGDYLSHLGCILGHANSVMFIDPHLDPSKRKYQDFNQLLDACKTQDINPLIEIHRIGWVGIRTNPTFPSEQDWINKFNRLSSSVQTKNITVKVYIWDDFHDRALISDIVGISLPNGFDISNHVNNLTTWSRIDRADKDDIQREFDPTSSTHTLRYQFDLNF